MTFMPFVAMPLESILLMPMKSILLKSVQAPLGSLQPPSMACMHASLFLHDLRGHAPDVRLGEAHIVEELLKHHLSGNCARGLST